eukprot:SAG22_NODE_23_length_31399_cov_35.631313_20_plen_505_part_00
MALPSRVTLHMVHTAAIGVCAQLVAAALSSGPPRTPQLRASGHSGVWPVGHPPKSVPSSKTVDGPLLGNGDVGLVAGVQHGRLLTFYLSKSDLWHLAPGRAGPKALGGFSIGVDAAALPVQFELRQDIGVGAVLWKMVTGGGPAPPSRPPPAPPGVPNCSIFGRWTTKLNSTADLNFTIIAGGGGKTGFVWNNTSPTVQHDGWRTATGTVDEATGAIELNYHRFRPRPSTARFHGAFTGDCSHVTIQQAGTWWRPGASPTAPPAPPAPPPPAPPAQPGKTLVSGRTTISQTDDISTVVTVIEAADSSVQHLTVGTFVQDGGSTAGSSGKIVWVARGVGGCSNATAAIATAVLADGDSDKDTGRSSSSSSSSAVGLTVAVGAPAVLTHTVVSSLDLGGGRTGPCSWDWHDPVPAAVAAAAAMDEAKARAIVSSSERFWSGYWNTSTLSLPTQPDVERFWFCAQYILGSSSRAGRAANGIWGIWVTTDRSAWGGAFTIDYNAEAPF